MFWHGYNNNSSDCSSNASFSVTSTVITDYYDEESEDGQSTPVQQQQEDDLLLPNGIYIELTHCYTPTCSNLYPCYSYTCPKRERLVCFFKEKRGGFFLTFSFSYSEDALIVWIRERKELLLMYTK